MRVPEPGPPRPPLPPPLGSVLSWVYGAAIARINRRFDRGRGVIRFDRPVISVGNLSVGGTGKTPMVRMIARVLLDAGHRPCIAMRGYGAGSGDSDEAAAYRRDFPDVPIVAQANRTLGLIQLFSRQHDEDGPHSDCIILDDGFQHRQIARDIDIVLIDASREPFRDRLLPAGWLREPVGSLRRAGAVVITHAESAAAADITALDRRIADLRQGEGALAVCRHAWTGLSVVNGGREDHVSVAWLSGKRAFAVCAIGNPGPFIAAARKAVGGALAGTMVLRDHDRYSPGTMRQIWDRAKSVNAQAIVTTDKDWSKLAKVPAGQWPCPVVRPRLELAFDRGEDKIRSVVVQTAQCGVPDDAVQGQVKPKV